MVTWPASLSLCVCVCGPLVTRLLFRFLQLLHCRRRYRRYRCCECRECLCPCRLLLWCSQWLFVSPRSLSNAFFRVSTAQPFKNRFIAFENAATVTSNVTVFEESIKASTLEYTEYTRHEIETLSAPKRQKKSGTTRVPRAH